MSRDWFNDRFSETEGANPPCLHRHVVVVTTGSRRFIAGEVTDDIEERLLCRDCLEYVSEAEVRAAWNGISLEEIAGLQLGDDLKQDLVSSREEVKE
jgi:hypothetical protein